MSASQSARGGSSSQVGIILATVFLAYLGQTTLNPVIAPLSRKVGLDEWQIGFTISVAAVMVVLTSQVWGRRSQSWGRKPVLIAALAICMAAMVLFAVVATLGVRGVLGKTPLFVLFVLTRGLLFGTALAAILPTAQAYVADVTLSEEERVRGMAGVGASQGIASIAGALVGGLLAGISIMVSVDMVPVILLGGLLVVVLVLRREERTELVAEPARVRPADPRVWPFLVAGFGMFTALGLIQVVTGFLGRTAWPWRRTPPAWSPAGRGSPRASAWCWPRASSCRARSGPPPPCCAWAPPWAPSASPCSRSTAGPRSCSWR